MNLKNQFSLSSVRKAAVLLPVVALLLVAADPAMANATGTNGAFGDVLNQVNGITPGVKALVAVVGFIVALVSLVALRSFSAVLFFLGLAVFGAGGLGMAQALLGASLSLL